VHSATRLENSLSDIWRAPCAGHCRCACCMVAYSCTNIPDSIKDSSRSVVNSQGVAATPPKLYGLARGHEAMAGRRRPVAQYGTFYLDQVKATVIPAATWGVRVCALTLSEGRTDQRPPGRAQPQVCGGGCLGISREGTGAPTKLRGSR
jgi:hypothetical protein